MNSIKSTESHLGLLTPHSILSDTSEEEKKIVKSIKGKTLEEVAEQQAKQLAQNADSPSVGIIKRLSNYWNSLKSEDIEAANSSKEGKKEPLAINFTPQIDVPDHLDVRFMNLKLAKSNEQTCKLSDQQIFDGLSLMSDTTIHRIMMNVLAAQEELSRDGALMNMDDLEKFQKIQSLQQKLLKEIKQALLSDEKISGYFNTAQTIAVAAGVLAAIGSLFGYEIPYAQIASGVSAAISIAGGSYFNTRADEDKAKLVAHEHEKRQRKGFIDSSSQRSESYVQANAESVQKAGKLLKSMVAISRSINSNVGG